MNKPKENKVKIKIICVSFWIKGSVSQEAWTVSKASKQVNENQGVQ